MFQGRKERKTGRSNTQLGLFLNTLIEQMLLSNTTSQIFFEYFPPESYNFQGKVESLGSTAQPIVFKLKM